MHERTINLISVDLFEEKKNHVQLIKKKKKKCSANSDTKYSQRIGLPVITLFNLTNMFCLEFEIIYMVQKTSVYLILI